MTHEFPGDHDEPLSELPLELDVFPAENLVRQMSMLGFITLPSHSVVDLSIALEGEKAGSNWYHDLEKVELKTSTEWRAVGNEVDFDKDVFYAILVPDSTIRRRDNRKAKKHLRELREATSIVLPKERKEAIKLRRNIDVLDARLARNALGRVNPSRVRGIDPDTVLAVVCKVRTDKLAYFVNQRGT